MLYIIEWGILFLFEFIFQYQNFTNQQLNYNENDKENDKNYNKNNLLNEGESSIN